MKTWALVLVIIFVLSVLRQRLAQRRAMATRSAAGPPSAAAQVRKEDVMDATMLFGLVRGYLDDEKFVYRVLEDDAVLEAVVRGESALFTARVRVLPEPLTVQVSVLLPVVMPERLRDAAAETTARANLGLRLGHFEYDASAGLVSFRNALPVADGTLTAEQFRVLLLSSLSTADQYHRAFCRLLYGDDLSPAEVVAEVDMAE